MKSIPSASGASALVCFASSSVESPAICHSLKKWRKARTAEAHLEGELHRAAHSAVMAAMTAAGDGEPTDFAIARAWCNAVARVIPLSAPWAPNVGHMIDPLRLHFEEEGRAAARRIAIVAEAIWSHERETRGPVAGGAVPASALEVAATTTNGPAVTRSRALPFRSSDEAP